MNTTLDTSLEMQSFLTALAAKHRIDLATFHGRLILELEGCLPLVIEREEPHTISVSHCLRGEWGDIEYQPQLTFFAGQDPWVPTLFTSAEGLIRTHCRLSRAGNAVEILDPKGQAELVELGDAWAWELQEQCWLERGQRAESF